MDDFTIEIEEGRYNRLVAKSEGMVFVLNNTKAKGYQVGNRLSIVNGENSFDVEIVEMLYFENIADIFKMINKKEFGYTPSKTITKIEDEFLTANKFDKVEKQGLVVIKFKKYEEK